ncbi:MAG: AAA family ATPase [Synergistaceae bacterium]|nr:AAA family ATPase [Synergistaceae bacterium]
MKNYEPVPTDLIEKQFTEFLYSIDGGAYAPIGEFNLILDKKTRYQVEGDKGRKTTGVYMVHSDGYPAGYVINYRISSEPIKWKFDSEVLKADKKYSALYNIMQTPEFKAEAERIRQEREAKEAAEKLKATNKAKAEWDGAQPATDEHAYLKRKNVKSYGLKVNREDALLVDFYNVEQEFKGTQRIFKDGFKPYADGCDKRGAFHIMDGEPIIDKEGIILAEGYATAASIHDCIGSDYKVLMPDNIIYNCYHVIMAIDCYNLLPVAKAIKSQYPNVTITIAADNDEFKHENTDGKNPGVDHAIECCKAGYAKNYITIDKNETNDGLTDWNDYYCKYGREATKQALIDALHAPLKPVNIEAQAEAQTPNYSDEEIAQMYAEYAAQSNDTGDFYGDYDNPQPSEAPVKKIEPEVSGEIDNQRVENNFELGKFAGRVKCINGNELLKKEFPPVKWAVQGILPMGLSLLAGSPKIGKSFLSLQLSLAVALGGVALGKIPVERGSALYLALEDPERRLKERMLNSGIDIETADLSKLDLVTELPRQDNGGAAFIKSWLDSHSDARLVIIDTLQKFRRAKQSKGDLYGADYNCMEGLKQLADAYTVPFLVIHHFRKTKKSEDSGDWVDNFLGTTGLAGAADTLLSLTRQRGQDVGILQLTGRDVTEAEFALKRDEFGWILEGDATEFCLSESERRIINFLKENGGKKPKEIADALGLESDEEKTGLRVKLGRMVSKNKISKTGILYFA